MKHLAAYLLAVLGGKENPTADDVRKIMEAGNVEVDNESLQTVVSELAGQSIEEVIASGKSKMSSMPVGVSASAAPAPSGDKTSSGSAPAAKEPEPESDEEDDADMGFSLFD